METVVLKLLEREDIHDPDGACRRIDHVKHGQSLCHVNQVNKSGYTALIWACCNKMETVALKILERQDINVNHVNKCEDTALIFVCKNEMETVALKLLEREDINFNQVNKDGKTALNYATVFKIESVINRINELNKK